LGAGKMRFGWYISFRDELLAGLLRSITLAICVMSASCGGSGGGDSISSPSQRPPVNTAPVVDAGADATIRLPENTLSLDATVTDDGLPSNSLTYTWRVSRGPGEVTFADGSAEDTAVTLAAAGIYVLELTASDSEQETSDTVQVTVEAAPVVSNLLVTPATVSLLPGDTQAFTVSATDQYGDPVEPDVTWTAAGGRIDQEGNFMAGNAPGSFTVTATAESISGTATVTIIASAPTADAGGPYTGAQGAIIGLDGSGSTDPNGDIVSYDWDLDGDGVFDDASGITPDYASARAGVFSIRLRVRDVKGASDSATTTVTVINLAPTAVSQSISTAEDSPVAVILGGSDPGDDPLICAVVSPPAHGMLGGVEPEVTYIPDPDFNGTDSFSYIVNDGELDSQPATVSIAISAVNDAPIASPQAVSTDEDTALDISLSGTDPDGDPLTYSIVSRPSNGTLSGKPPALVYMPSPDFNGSDGFSFAASDGVLESITANVSISVDAVNDPPTVSYQSLKAVANESVRVELAYEDVDGPGPYVWQVTTAPKFGSLSAIDADGSVHYTPDPEFTGTDQFKWRVSDGLDDSAGAIVSVTVEAKVPAGMYFPPAGESLSKQSLKSPGEVGLTDSVVAELAAVITTGRWDEVKSLRKIIHAATVGVAIQRHLVPSLDQKVSAWNPELSGINAAATWFHVMTQTSAFDEPSMAPGSLWAYSDENPLQLCRALARVWGRSDYTDRYDLVISDALFDAIGARGWSSVPAADGIRFRFDLEDLGRAGLLMVAGGEWSGHRLMPLRFVEELGTKQTYGIQPNYDNDNDGHTELRVEDFPESPYGFLTWVNTDRDLYPGSSADWVVALGVGGHYLVYSRKFGLVLAIIDGDFVPIDGNPPGWPTPVRIAVEALEQGVAGSNPLVE
jgi:hypothetical protein